MRKCKECNVEVGKWKVYCPVCLSIREKAQKKIYNDKAAGYRKERYDNRDKDAYNAYHREYQKGKKFREYQAKYTKDRYQNDPEFREMVHGYQRKSYRKRMKRKKAMNYVDMDRVINSINNKIKLDFSS